MARPHRGRTRLPRIGWGLKAKGSHLLSPLNPDHHVRIFSRLVQQHGGPEKILQEIRKNRQADPNQLWLHKPIRNALLLRYAHRLKAELPPTLKSLADAMGEASVKEDLDLLDRVVDSLASRLSVREIRRAHSIVASFQESQQKVASILRERKNRLPGRTKKSEAQLRLIENVVDALGNLGTASSYLESILGQQLNALSRQRRSR